MAIISGILLPLQDLFSSSDQGRSRARWFVYTIVAVVLPFTSSKTSNLLRALTTLFHLNITRRRYYTFMASSKLPWRRLWEQVWRAIPNPTTAGRVMLALDDFINPKTGKKIFGCHHFFDHAAKLNQSKYPWSQNVVTVGLLKKVKGRWACLPLAWRFYHLKNELENAPVRIGKKAVQFQTKLEQAVEMILEVARHFANLPILVVSDSWYGNRTLLAPLRNDLGELFHLLSRLRSNSVLYELPSVRRRGPGRPRKYGQRLGTTAEVAARFKESARTYRIALYGKVRDVLACERVVLLKSLRCQIRVVWVYRQTQWVALFSTDLSLSVTEIIQWYGARWKIESGYKELKQDIGSSKSQTRNPHAVINHLNFCTMATTLVWIYGDRIATAPSRRHAVRGRRHFAFSDVRHAFVKDALEGDLDSVWPGAQDPVRKSLAVKMLKMVA